MLPLLKSYSFYYRLLGKLSNCPPKNEIELEQKQKWPKQNKG